jgi:hypothetical protein
MGLASPHSPLTCTYLLWSRISWGLCLLYFPCLFNFNLGLNFYLDQK